MAFRGRWLRALILGLALGFAPACATLEGGTRGIETLEAQIQALEARLRTLEARREQVPAAVARARSAVAFIWGAYTFVDEAGFFQLRTFFQDRADPVPIEVLRADPELDVALVRTIGWTPTAEPLAIHPRPDRITEGQAVMLVGFPTGLDAVLSKLTTQEYAALERAGTDTLDILRVRYAKGEITREEFAGVRRDLLAK